MKMIVLFLSNYNQPLCLMKAGKNNKYATTKTLVWSRQNKEAPKENLNGAQIWWKIRQKKSP